MNVKDARSDGLQLVRWTDEEAKNNNNDNDHEPGSWYHALLRITLHNKEVRTFNISGAQGGYPSNRLKTAHSIVPWKPYENKERCDEIVGHHTLGADRRRLRYKQFLTHSKTLQEGMEDATKRFNTAVREWCATNRKDLQSFLVLDEAEFLKQRDRLLGYAGQELSHYLEWKRKQTPFEDKITPAIMGDVEVKELRSRSPDDNDGKAGDDTKKSPSPEHSHEKPGDDSSRGPSPDDNQGEAGDNAKRSPSPDDHHRKAMKAGDDANSHTLTMFAYTKDVTYQYGMYLKGKIGKIGKTWEKNPTAA